MSVETKRRVKVYSFGEKLQWEDMGTGQISMDYVERNQVLTIIVRSEVDGKNLLATKQTCIVCVHVVVFMDSLPLLILIGQ